MTAARALDSTLAALADRRRVVDLLRQRPRRPGELATALAVSPPVISRHVRVLRHQGLVEEERSDPRDSRVRVYRLRREPFADLRAWLDQVEAFWAERLGAFKAHAGRRSRGKRS